MAKLPKIEVAAIIARDELHRGNRESGLAFLARAGDGPIARELRALTKRRGRQPFGRSHLWWDIGIDNEELTDQGMGYEHRRETLGARYMLDPTQIAIALAKYQRARAEIEAVDAEDR